MNAPAVNASAAPTEVRLGGKFTVFIEATFAPGVMVNLQEPVELGGAFEVRRKVSQDNPQADGRTTREWQLEVIAWDIGDLIIRPITVTYTAYGKVGQVQTNTIKLVVHGVLGDVVDDPKAMRGQHAPVVLQSRDLFWLWIAALAVFVGGAVITVVLIATGKKQKPLAWIAPVLARRADMTSARALERLKAIEDSGVLDRDHEDRKRGYFEMAEVIRDYVGARYRVSPQELTSHELLEELDRVGVHAEERGLVRAWLDRADLVKYGGLKATQADAHGTLRLARELVAATTAKPAAEPAEPAAPAAPPTPPTEEATA